MIVIQASKFNTILESLKVTFVSHWIKQTWLLLKCWNLALTNLHNTRAVGICEAIRTLTGKGIISQSRQTDATIFTWIGVANVTWGTKSQSLTFYVCPGIGTYPFTWSTGSLLKISGRQVSLAGLINLFTTLHVFLCNILVHLFNVLGCIFPYLESGNGMCTHISIRMLIDVKVPKD